MFLSLGPTVSSIVWDHWHTRELLLSISAGKETPLATIIFLTASMFSVVGMEEPWILLLDLKVS